MSAIRNANEIWSGQANKQMFEKSCKYVMESIERASAAGLRDTCFAPPHNAMYDSVKREFLKHGYTFRPTGYIGGVWQLTEQICW